MKTFANSSSRLVLPPVLAILALGLVVGVLAAKPKADETKPKPPFRDAIDRFLKQDAQNPPPGGATLFVGSSSIRMWHRRLAKDFPERVVIGRGFGGSVMRNVLFYFDEIVSPYKPAVIVVYEGDNDLASPRSRAENVIPRFEKFLARVAKQLPTTDVVFLPAKPSPARWRRWEEMRKLNAHLQKLAEECPRVWYADTAGPMLADSAPGEPPAEKWFKRDGLHLSPAGYDLWTKVVQETLDQVAADRKKRGDPSALRIDQPATAPAGQGGSKP